MATNVESRSAPGRRPDADQPQRLGKYTIQKRLGAGGMGTVFLALDSELNRTVALKVLPRERAANATLVKRFKSEGQAAARLEHDNIVKVFDFGEIDGHLYLALEYVDGVDAQDLVLKRGVVPVRRSIEIIRQVAAALQHACERNIVHRDIKPSNLMIRRDGMVKLADMGLARAIDETAETSITRDGMTVGTVDYMAPEQARDSKQADIRSDIYSLGCTWYFLLTGSPPFPEGSVTSKLQAHANQPLPDPRQKNDRVPEALAAVIQRMTAKRPIDRYQTPAELIEDLKQAHLSRANVDADVLAGLNEGAMPDADGPAAETGHGGARSSTDAAVEPLPQKMKVKKPRRSSPEERAAATRQANDRRAAAKASTKAAALPQRAENPEALGVSQRRLDPELIKYGTFGLVGAVIVGCVAWALVRLNRGSEALGGGGFNPYQATTEPGASGNGAPSQPPIGPSTAADGDDPGTPAVATPQATVVNARPSDADPFPGVEEAGRNSAVSDVPDWVYVERAASHKELRTYAVSPGSGPGTFPSVAAAVAATPRQGGVIEFVGRGPYYVPPLTVADRESIVLRAAPGSSPVLVLTPGPSGTGPGITLRSGRLEVAGLHLVASAHEVAADTALLTVEQGVLFAHDCSLSLAGAGPLAASAIALRGTGVPSRGILEDVVIRGQRLSAVALSGPGHELIAGSFLFACGDAPAVIVARPARLAGAAGEPPTVVLELLAGFAFSRTSALELAHGPGLESPHVRLRARRVAFVGGPSSVAGVVLDRWPENPASDLEHARAKGIAWQVDEAAWAGWPHLTQMTSPDGAVTATVTDATQWRQFWRVPLASDAVLELGADDLDGDPTRVTADAVAARLSAAGLQLPHVGPDATRLPQLPESMLQRVLAIAGRPRLPAGFGAATGRRVEVDLATQGLKLNGFLNSDACPDGATVVLSGSGVRPIEPVTLRNKSLRLEFRATENRLIVEPNARTGGDRPAALFHVEGGRIDLVGAHLRILASETRKYPLRVLQVVDGDFSIQNCLIQGQIGAGAQDVSTVEWTCAAANHGAAPHCGLITNSMVTGNAAAVGTNLSGGLLELRNSILASAADGLHVQVNGAPEQAMHLVISDCTFSCPDTVLRVESAGSPGGPRLNVYVDQSVFGPSTAPAQGGPAIIAHAAGAETSGRIVWWEERTAYDRRISRYRRITGSPSDAAQDFAADWIRGWGPDHVVDALADPTAVLLASSLPAPERATPESFILAPNCRAAQFRVGGGPIGARIEAVGPDSLASTPAAPQQQPKPTTPRSNQPDF